ncbi:hypothetical protein, partial [Thiolapillus sp.]
MTRTAGAQIGCQRPSRFWGLGCPKIYHEAEDTLVAQAKDLVNAVPIDAAKASDEAFNSIFKKKRKKASTKVTG